MRSLLMAAFDTFYELLCEGDLPVAIPVFNEDGSSGLAASGMVFKNNKEAQSIVLSADPRERAIAALYAIERTQQLVAIETDLSPQS